MQKNKRLIRLRVWLCHAFLPASHRPVPLPVLLCLTCRITCLTCPGVGHFCNLFFISATRAFFGVMALSDHKYSFQKLVWGFFVPAGSKSLRQQNAIFWTNWFLQPGITKQNSEKIHMCWFTSGSSRFLGGGGGAPGRTSPTPSYPQIRVSPRILATLFWKCTKIQK